MGGLMYLKVKNQKMSKVQRLGPGKTSASGNLMMMQDMNSPVKKGPSNKIIRDDDDDQETAGIIMSQSNNPMQQLFKSKEEQDQFMSFFQNMQTHTRSKGYGNNRVEVKGGSPSKKRNTSHSGMDIEEIRDTNPRPMNNTNTNNSLNP